LKPPPHVASHPSRPLTPALAGEIGAPEGNQITKLMAIAFVGELAVGAANAKNAKPHPAHKIVTTPQPEAAR